MNSVTVVFLMCLKQLGPQGLVEELSGAVFYVIILREQWDFYKIVSLSLKDS
jgi:hypothetical protein